MPDLSHASKRQSDRKQDPFETAENTACSSAANLRTLRIQHEVMLLASRGGVGAAAWQQADYPGGKNAT
jgi:hypothetical protein